MKIRTLSVLGITCLCLQATPVFPASDMQPAAEQELANRFATYFSSQVTKTGITGAAFAVASPAGAVRIGTVGYTDTSQEPAYR